jgi:citrate/tricarballylate utilization protein
LLAVALSGLLLLVLRATPAMGVLLAVHLGLVFAFFLVLPATRFVHAPFRLLALLRDAVETRLETERARATLAGEQP